MLVPYRKPKRSYVIPVVTTLAVAAPLAALTMSDSSDYRSTTDSELAAVPAQLAEMALASAPDITLPLRDLTGLDLPDLHLSDLRMLPLPSSLRIPDGLPLPPGIQLPREIPLPKLNSGQSPTAPGPSPNSGSSRNIPGQSEFAPGQFPTAPGQRPNAGQYTAPSRTAPTPPIPGRAPIASFIADTSLLEPGTTPDTPALAPGAVPPDLVDQVGAQVKELSRETPFSVVALTAKDLVNTNAMVRARQPDGAWGPWYDTEAVDTRRTDHAPAGGTTGTEPIYVGDTEAVQILVTRKPVASTMPQEPATPMPPTPAAARSDDPAQINAAAMNAVLIDPGRGAIDGELSNVAAALPGGGPNVITRAQWGADESIRCEEPTYDADGVGAVTVHHTAGRNDYSKAESAGIVRAIYAYHATTLGWCDIGYNALVDKYGQIFEGRFGGLDRPVQGAHAGGFNENTSGVSLMGNYESEEPSDEAINAIGKFVGWKTKVAGLDPKGYTTMYSEGTEFTSYAQGESVRLPIVFAHRDVGNTSCPGDAAYAMMDRIRDIAASGAGHSSAPAQTTQPQTGNTQTQNGTQQQTAPHAQSDLATLAALTNELLAIVNESGIARYWFDHGGPTGMLGAAKSLLLPAAQGQQYAKFTNGYVYSAPDGQVYAVMGALLDRFLALGADAGVLGLPLSNSYPVPNGLRSDFQYGSLVFNQLTGIVTTVWKTYNDTYQQEMGRKPNNRIAAPGPAPAPAPGVAPTAVPGDAPAHGADPAPAPEAAPAPGVAPAPETASTPGVASAPETVPAPEAGPAPE
ncbi:N-acetylmuramoyl-L-alanine amidase [Nocardia sp. NBC_01009]|uniref:N-acetylmuramoyl-L-alanine amidase n=1 Tax=Nocardia sp. NBC_01009 TaxID=2975996 RepID=UPI003864B39E|nr:N-acetylmuramoyl-L-alanine amidase [Nocardia sp. NBC_01009]